MKNLFGEEETDVLHDVLRQRFIEPPFSVLDTKQGNWINRRNTWKQLGFKPEIVSQASSNVYAHISSWGKEFAQKETAPLSIFDPALCEVLYRWFAPEGGKILDPFAGGSVRGIIANFLGYNYTGIDVRQEQVDSNREQALDILPVNNQPQWYVGDSNKVLDGFSEDFDFVFSCPPYGNLEVYSDDEGDISNKEYPQFLELYRSIITKSCSLLKKGCYACFVVSDYRDKNGTIVGFVPDTIKAFNDAGMQYYNEIILLNSCGTAPIRATLAMRKQKVIRIHQNILVFKK